MSFLFQTWHYLMNCWNLCWSSEPQFRVIPSPTRVSGLPKPQNMIPMSFSNSEVDSPNNFQFEANSPNNSQSTEPMEIPAFEPDDMLSNTKIFITGRKGCGKTILAQNIIQELCDDSQSLDTTCLILSHQMSDWQSQSHVRIVQPLQTLKIIEIVTKFLKDWQITQTLSESDGQAFIVFDETFTSELMHYPIIQQLFIEKQLNLIVISQVPDNFNTEILKLFDYHMIYGRDLGRDLSQTPQIKPIPEIVIEYFELFTNYRFLVIDNDNKFSWYRALLYNPIF